MSLARPSASFWEASDAGMRIGDYFPKLLGQIGCEVCVVGGGITGTTLAYLLAGEGVDVVLVEAEEIGAGATGGSTAHLDPLTDIRLSSLISTYGLEKAKKVLKSNLEAMELIKDVIRTYAIDCGFQELDSVLFAENGKQDEELRAELAAALELGLDPVYEKEANEPFSCFSRIVYSCHARFDPLRYTFDLAKAAKRTGARIFQKSRVREIQQGNLVLDEAVVRAQHIVLATHVPLGLHPVLQSRIFPYRSYVIGARVEREPEDALYLDMDVPYHYIRKAQDEGGSLLLIGGEDHKSGADPGDPYRALRDYASRKFGLKAVEYAWSSQYYLSADGLPYIGNFSGERNLWYATGFEGNGLTFGTVAARLLKNLILDEGSVYAELYSPSRFNIASSGKTIVSEGISVAKSILLERFEKNEKTAQDLDPGEGAIIVENGDQVACYRDMDGDVHALSPVCTHAKCRVRWNSLDKCWDCPCHGGRYSALGEVVSGPPTKDLERLDLFISAKKSQTSDRDRPEA